MRSRGSGSELLAEPAQGQPGRDHPQVAQPGAEPREVAGAQGPVQHRLADEVPQPGGPVVERLPGRTGAGAERTVERRRHGRRVERQVEAGAVGEPVAADRVDGFELQLGRPARGGEQLREHLRQREQRRTGVEGEPVAPVLPQLAAVRGGALVQHHAGARAPRAGRPRPARRRPAPMTTTRATSAPDPGRAAGEAPPLPGQLTPPVPAPRRRQQPQQRSDRHRVRQRVGPGPSAAVPRRPAPRLVTAAP